MPLAGEPDSQRALTDGRRSPRASAPMPRRKTFRVYSWNVNGLRSVVKKGFFDWLKGARADVVGLQETRAWPEHRGSVYVLSDTGVGIPANALFWGEVASRYYSRVLRKATGRRRERMRRYRPGNT